MFCEYGLEDAFFRLEQVNIVTLKEMLFDQIKHTWAEEIWSKPKLRTYREIKYDYYTENYVLFNLPKKRRSLCAQIRGGILPLYIETGRYVGLDEERICQMCDLNEIENEYHFVLYCPCYCRVREELFNNINYVHMLDISDSQLINCLFEKHVFKLANYLEKAWDLRKKALYSQ